MIIPRGELCSTAQGAPTLATMTKDGNNSEKMLGGTMRLSATDPDLETLVGRIERGDIDLQPDFQRGEIWAVTKKKRLIDSILRQWHIPPVHLVVRQNGIQEVLDGQQRLAAIRDFVRNEFSIDGHIEPSDITILPLNRLKYRDLPEDTRRQFDRFTIRTFLLTDYNPEEPGELFFRLNQISSLTSAEQRNAFYGAARDQVRSVVDHMANNIGEDRIGFSNKRMAYDDVISKFLYHWEVGSIAIKTSSGDLSERFRRNEEFSTKYVNKARDCIDIIFSSYDGKTEKYRLNKAILLSWMLFVSRASERTGFDFEIQNFLGRFVRMARPEVEGEEDGDARREMVRRFAKIFTDRASFRVSDVSSVVVRDFALWCSYLLSTPQLPLNYGPPGRDHETLNALLKSVNWSSPGPIHRTVQSWIVDLPDWGRLHAPD